jgi:glycine/D-amino acid oxidase-like deaminating enzyme
VRGERLRAAACLYSNTPDLHFVIDAHPAHKKVLLVSACSGHGFKFASAIGEAAAQWALEGVPRLDLSLFSLERF